MKMNEIEVKENLKPEKKKKRSKSSTTTKKDDDNKVEKRNVKSHKEKRKSSEAHGEQSEKLKSEHEPKNNTEKHAEIKTKSKKAQHQPEDVFDLRFDDARKVEQNLQEILNALNQAENVKLEKLKMLHEKLLSLPSIYGDNHVPDHETELSAQVFQKIVEKIPEDSKQDFDWLSLWLNYLQFGNPYFLKLLNEIPEGVFNNLSDQKKLSFLNDLYNFLITIKDSRNPPFSMSASDEDDFTRLIEDPLKCCLLKAGNFNQFCEPTNRLLKLCLETGPGNTAHFYRAVKINVFDRTGYIMLNLIFESENVSDLRQKFNLNIVRQNAKLFINIFILNHKHKCDADKMKLEMCTCYNDPNMFMYSTVEKYIFEKSPKSVAQDVVLYVTDVIRKFELLTPYAWLDFVRVLHPQAKSETEKNFDLYFNALKITDPSFELRIKTVLQLLQAIAQKNAGLFTVEKVTLLEDTCLFEEKCSSTLKNMIFHIFLDISQQNCEPFFKTKGQAYYQVADSINTDSMMTVNNLMKNVGLRNQQECERVVNIMEKEVTKNESNKTFVQHVFITWKDMVMDNVTPFKKRRAFLKKYVDDPKLGRNTKDILAMSEPESKSCVIC